MKEHYTIAENEDLITKFDFLKDMPGYFSVIDTKVLFKGMSPEIAILLGWKKASNAITQSAYDIPSKAAEAAGLYHKYLNVTMQLKKQVTAIQAFNCDTKISILRVQAVAIIDTNNIVKGAFYSSIDLTEFLQRKYKWLDGTDNKFINSKHAPKQYILTPEASPLPLTHRQQECLALLIRGKNYKEIAYMLDISNRVVEDHIHAIKYKLGCYNKSQLIEKVIDSGFLFHIPITLLGLK